MENQLYFSIQSCKKSETVLKGINRGKQIATVKMYVWYSENGQNKLVDIREMPVDHKFASNVQYMLDHGYIQSQPFDLQD